MRSATVLSGLLAAVMLPAALAGKGMGHRGLRDRKPSAMLAKKEAREMAKRANVLETRASSMNTTTNFRYHSNKTDPFLVDSLPDVPFDVGELYSGLIPIDYSNASRALFFVFQPTINDPVDEVTIWFNGGPGCSSLEGFFQETGRFVWQPGTYAPLINPYSWVNQTNVLWVEQPVGTGFSIGTPTATSEEEIAQDFIKFFKNFQTTFGIKNYKIFVTGESYAGRYVPYVSAAMIDANNTEYYNLTGALMYDPCIGDCDEQQEEIPAYPYVAANHNLFMFNNSFMAALEKQHEDCGYADYIAKHLQFPPNGLQPTTVFNYSNSTCDIFDLIINEATVINPCFDIYETVTQCPFLYDVLGFPGDFFDVPQGASIYFNRSDVKAAMHAPDYVDWNECSAEPVFVAGDQGPQSNGDLSDNPNIKVLPKVIEATNRVLVSNGDLDFVVITNGTLLAIQNMTWGGQQGFQSAPHESIVIELPDIGDEYVFEENGATADEISPRQGVMGIQHYERGLMWARTFLSGHMQPQYQPRSSYRHLQWVRGEIDSL